MRSCAKQTPNGFLHFINSPIAHDPVSAQTNVADEMGARGQGEATDLFNAT